MSENYRVAVVGATGNAGGKVLEVLSERDLPIAELVPFASARSEGQSIAFNGEAKVCRTLTAEGVGGFDIVFLAAGGSIARDWAPKFAAAGAIVIDKSSFWRMHEDVPLVVPEINPDMVELALRGRRIIASPNCSTMAMVMALAPIQRDIGIEEIVVSTYQSVSGTGRAAVQELEAQTHAILHGTAPPAPEVYPHQIAFNVLPHVETFADDSGYTTEERKMMDETRKILGVTEAQLRITATCVRVPVISSHSESIRIRTRRPVELPAVRELLASADGIVLNDDPAAAGYPTALAGADRDEVFVGRLRHDPGPGGDSYINMWVVGDNLRKGAATNAIQIAELLHARGSFSSQQPVALAD